MKCSVGECPNPGVARGLCAKHYYRWKANGDPTVTRRPFWGATEDQRFWSKVEKIGPTSVTRPELGRCWIWTAAKVSKGYGNFTLADGSSEGAHRWAYKALVGPIPEGLTLDHLCRVRSCVNPAHLEPCPAVENYQRGDTGGLHHRLKTHCPKGHPYSGDNLYGYMRDGSPRRGCKTCRYEATRKRQESLKKPRLPKTHCPAGHPFNEANTFLLTKPSGTISKVCKVCKRASNERSRSRKR